MSFKGIVEDKSGNTPPRACLQLREAVAEVRSALKTLDRGAIRAGLESLEGARLRANTAMIRLASIGGDMGHLQAYSAACNEALAVRAQATVVLDQSHG